MNNGETLTHKWLRQNVQSYSRGDRVYADVTAVLSRFPTIRPKTDVYTFDDGRTQLLLCIHGLLPITFRQASYNIPIAIWITHDYPRQPPLAYVVPTSDMLVRAGKYMAVSGRCTIPYAQNWERKNEGCNLLSLMEEMQAQFSREPPVYAKSKQDQTRSAASSGTPVSHEPQLQSNSPVPQSSNDIGRPPIPPKPGASISNGVPSRPVSVAWPGQVDPIARVMSPAVPPRPTPNLSMFSSPAQHQRSVSMHIPSPSTSSTVHSHPPRPMSPLSPSTQRWSMPPPFQQNAAPGYHTLPIPPVSNAQLTQPSASFGAPNVATSSYFSNPPPNPPQPAPRPQPVNLLEEPSIEPAGSSMKSTRAPPRPMNPELVRLHVDVHAKLTSELASLSQAMALDAERLRAHQRDLLLGEPAIRDEMARLEAVKDVCRGVAGRLGSVVGQAEKNISELKRKGDPEVDELVCSTSIVHNQLINLVAEENAIEDTIYHLHRALNTGRIDLERFLRTTRVLAEEQFMKKALIEKIQAGLPMSQWA